MINKKRTIFLTGATGLVGSYLLRLLLENGNKVYVLARSKNSYNAETRVLEILQFWDEKITKNITRNLRVIDGDISYHKLGIKSKEIIRLLNSEVNIVFHSAALLDFRSPIRIIRNINVEGTRRVIDFALEFKHLKKINYISTAFVVGKKTGQDFSEDMLELDQEFNNTYEQTKYEAEIMIRDYKKRGVNISVFRPSAIVGDSKKGKTNNLNLFYESLKLFSREIYDEFPSSIDCFLNYINVDSVANIIFMLAEREKPKIYHLTSKDDTNSWNFIQLAADYFGFKMPKFIPLKDFNFNRWTPAQKILAQPFIPYINYNTKLISFKTHQILQRLGFVYPKINEDNFIRLFQYCSEIGFIKRKLKDSIVLDSI